MPLRSTHRTRVGRIPFHSQRCQTLEQVLPRCCHSTVCPSYGLVVIVSQDSFRRWSGDVWPDTPSSVSVAESRSNLAQCMLDSLWFCTIPFGPVSITPPGVSEVAIVGTGVSLSSPVVYGSGQCAESMLYVVLSRARYSPLAACGYSVLDRVWFSAMVAKWWVD
jgi:hypothetical protein